MFQNCPRGEGNCAAAERQKLSRGKFCLAASRCLSDPLGSGPKSPPKCPRECPRKPVCAWKCLRESLRECSRDPLSPGPKCVQKVTYKETLLDTFKSLLEGPQGHFSRHFRAHPDFWRHSLGRSQTWGTSGPTGPKSCRGPASSQPVIAKGMCEWTNQAFFLHRPRRTKNTTRTKFTTRSIFSTAG